MRSRDDPTAPRRGPAKRRRPSVRKRTHPRRETETPPRGRRRRTGPSPVLLPCVTLAALAVAAIPAAVRAASGFPREWSLALAACLGVAGCWLTAIGVAHVAASVAASRSGTRR
ncbi:hypothetical protein [Halorubrum sp. CSM-61]|uniref:hypothetical protein n=1 Tax=Halorubrum sp. CSM-61 TaxID=2485838 RepID=UPI000F4C08C5|nr:hypothetical protein [Halorubrum sp. CSM-61]